MPCEHAGVAAGQLAGVQRDRRDRPLVDADLDAAADERWVEAVGRWCRSAGADPAAPSSSSVWPCQASTAAATPSPRAPRRAGRRAGPAGSCACARWPCSPSRQADLGSRARWRTGGPAQSWSPGSPAAARPRPWPAGRRARRSASRLELPADRGERLARATVVAVDAGLPVPDQRRRQTAEALQAAGDPGQQVFCLLRDEQFGQGRTGGPTTALRGRSTRRLGHDGPLRNALLARHRSLARVPAFYGKGQLPRNRLRRDLQLAARFRAGG